MSPERTRRGERGFSLIEAIVVVTLTGLLTLMILPLLPRTSAQSANVAARANQSLDEARGERQLRLLLRAALSEPDPDGADEEAPDHHVPGRNRVASLGLQGDAQTLLATPALSQPLACASAGASVIQLIVRAGALRCRSGANESVLVALKDGAEASFSYSRDGRSWNGRWEGPGAPYVRFQIRRGALVERTIIERAGGAPS
ncbi:type II secretion system protein [Candidatus Viadribacter manganicus]|nr:prepilin-type N-terminal cleavage/methylation domain-containing protein [Candidatus Viadribacter manganicus]